MINRPNAGFTFVELMIALFIISILLTIATYGYVKSNNTSKKIICIANLKQVDSAIDRWVLENHISAETAITGYGEDIYRDYVRHGKPKCPSAGEYTLGVVGVSPQVTCSKEDEGHKLP